MAIQTKYDNRANHIFLIRCADEIVFENDVI